jgi:hypothetical protein
VDLAEEHPMFTHPLVIYSVAQARMDDLQRAAAEHRLAAVARAPKARHARVHRLLPHRKGSAAVVQPC